MTARHISGLWLAGLAFLALVANGCDDESESTPTGTTSGTTAAGTSSGTGGIGGSAGTGGTGGTGGTAQGGQAGNPQGGSGGGGGCIVCSAVWNDGGDPADLCTDNGVPSSSSLFNDLKVCACDAQTCDNMCANSLCADLTPANNCKNCAESDCSSAVQSCTDDT